jgi:hypothetical protein
MADLLTNFSDAVDSQRLMAHCEDFAKWVKLSGSPDELTSMKVIQGKLDDYGYRTRLILHDAYISLPGEARVVVDGGDVTAITHSFSIPAPDGLSAPLVYLGEGTAADFARSDLSGCIVLVEGIASPGVASRAATAGVVGQLHISPHEHLHEMCISPVWGNPSSETLAELPQTVTCTISNADGTALRDRLAKGDTPTVTLYAKVDTGWRKTPILQADMDGPEPDGPFVLFSGHHDTWYYGVMDNGSANATMLETARLLAQGRDQWQRGFRLCFWSGHSHGRYSGSSWYVDNHWDELERRCAVHVNVDSTGGIGASVMTESAVASELAGLAADVVLAETNQAHEGRRVGRNSDMSFWGVGIPTLFGSLSHQPPSPVKMRNPLGWWWHTPHDLLDKIDPANLARDTRVFVRALWRLVTDPVLPLDYAAHARSLLREITALEDKLAGRLTLAPLMQAAQAVCDKAAAVHGEPASVNRALMAASRALVPVDYTSGDRFSHDPALPQAPWPVLDPIRALAAASGPDAIGFATVAAVRARNRMLHALQQASLALGSVA